MPVKTHEGQEDIAVTNFRRYLRIRTVQPNPEYAACKEFLFAYADELDFTKNVYEPVTGKPIVVFTIAGSDPGLPSIMLYSHTDVVQAVEEQWSHDPFAAHKDHEGNIYGRGAQDMKSVGIQYCEALRRLKSAGKTQFRRTIHIVWGPDEEIGGEEGMKGFVETKEFRQLNIGFTLDEGMATTGDVHPVFYSERISWWLQFSCKGAIGHGSLIFANSAAEKLGNVIAYMNSFREEEKKKLDEVGDDLDAILTRLGSVVTMNLTVVEGGQQVNVIPHELRAFYNMWIPPTIATQKLKDRFQECCDKAGKDVTWKLIKESPMPQITMLDEHNEWWRTFAETLKSLNCQIRPVICPGGTDARWSREKGIPALGFSPMAHTPMRAHNHDEYLNETVFLKGIEIYSKLIENLANHI